MTFIENTSKTRIRRAGYDCSPKLSIGTLRGVGHGSRVLRARRLPSPH
ncbi:hypothetical protein ACFQ7B_41565 [Streptomyces erythrochromogenes]